MGVSFSAITFNVTLSCDEDTARECIGDVAFDSMQPFVDFDGTLHGGEGWPDFNALDALAEAGHVSGGEVCYVNEDLAALVYWYSNGGPATTIVGSDALKVLRSAASSG